jgi:hypothetical protein
MANRYPIGIQTFSDVIEGDFSYVDKTDLVYQLTRSKGFYFLGRPRRFGKSLLVSTLESYFRGKKELFKGLAMERLEKEWVSRPVLHLDLNSQNYETPGDLDSILLENVIGWEALYGRDEAETSVSRRFGGVIRRACEQTGQQVAILVDEYDKPLIAAMDNDELDANYRAQLKAFYGVLKSADRYIYFALLTGVTRFSHVSIFSDLNNLQDISLSMDYATLCGITETELMENFKDDIGMMAHANDLSYEDTLAQLRRMYDGYHFSAHSEGVYNPFSLLNAFSSRDFGSYWFETGTPTLLLNVLRRQGQLVENFNGIQVGASDLKGTDNAGDSIIPLFYQSGYLTIKDYNREDRLYTLGFPNREVEEGFLYFLEPHYINNDGNTGRFLLVQLRNKLRQGDIDAFLSGVRSLLASTPNMIVGDAEKYFHNALFIIFRLLGFLCDAEVQTSQGRIDLVVRMKDVIYVMEFKYNGSVDEALAQIDGKGYLVPYQSDGRRVVKVAANFDGESRTLKEWKVE